MELISNVLLEKGYPQRVSASSQVDASRAAKEVDLFKTARPKPADHREYILQVRLSPLLSPSFFSLTHTCIRRFIRLTVLFSKAKSLLSDLFLSHKKVHIYQVLNTNSNLFLPAVRALEAEVMTAAVEAEATAAGAGGGAGSTASWMIKTHRKPFHFRPTHAALKMEWDHLCELNAKENEDKRVKDKEETDLAAAEEAGFTIDCSCCFVGSLFESMMQCS
jgi:hypothetical protein